jgi:hypothetical protein
MRGLQRIVEVGRAPRLREAARGRWAAHQLALVVRLQPRLVGDEDGLRVGVARLEERVEQLDVFAHRRLHRVGIPKAEGIVRHDGYEAVAAVHAGPAPRPSLSLSQPPLGAPPRGRAKRPPSWWRAARTNTHGRVEKSQRRR